jgi:hypothetical protein
MGELVNLSAARHRQSKKKKKKKKKNVLTPVGFEPTPEDVNKYLSARGTMNGRTGKYLSAVPTDARFTDEPVKRSAVRTDRSGF